MITRSFNGKSSYVQCFKYLNDCQETVAADDLPTLLADLGLGKSRMNGIRIKQNQATTACLSPLALLTFIETMCGSISLKQLIEENKSNIDRAVIERDELHARVLDLRKELSLISPILDDLKIYFSDVLKVKRAQIAALAHKLKLLKELTLNIDDSIEERKEALAELLVTISELEAQLVVDENLKEKARLALEEMLQREEISKKKEKKWKRLVVHAEQKLEEKKINASEQSKYFKRNSKKVSVLWFS